MYTISLRKVQNGIYSLLFLLILINGIIENYISIFGYFDELLAISAIVYILINGKTVVRNNACSKIIIATVLVVIIGLLGNLFFKFQPNAMGIATDILAFIKTPVIACALITRKYIGGNDDEIVLDNAYVISKNYVFIVGVLGLVSLVVNIGLSYDLRNGIYSYKFLYSHPTFLAYSLVCTSVILVAKNNKKDSWLIFLNLVTLILTMRDKAIGYVLLFVIIMYLFPLFKIRKLKLYYFVIPIFLVFLYLKDKMEEYLNYSWSARTTLYFKGLEIMKKSFPLGSGFGTWGGSSSGKYYSNLYYIYGMNNKPGMSPDGYYNLGDAGLPYYYADFGIFGFALFCYILKTIFSCALRIYNSDPQKKKAVILLICYILISLPFENVLTNESGATIMFVMFMFLGSATRK